MTTLELGAHVAILDVVGGTGVFLLPRPADDVVLDGPATLHATSWESALRTLDSHDWGLVLDDDELPVCIGEHHDGREALALVQRGA